MKLVKVKIHGRVQGVFFRSETKRKADELNLAGFVRNEPDGTVYVEAEGNEKSLKIFLDWCRSGPDSAEVDGIDSEFSEHLKKYEEFEIRH